MHLCLRMAMPSSMLPLGGGLLLWGLLLWGVCRRSLQSYPTADLLESIWSSVPMVGMARSKVSLVIICCSSDRLCIPVCFGIHEGRGEADQLQRSKPDGLRIPMEPDSLQIRMGGPDGLNFPMGILSIDFGSPMGSESRWGPMGLVSRWLLDILMES